MCTTACLIFLVMATAAGGGDHKRTAVTITAYDGSVFRAELDLDEVEVQTAYGVLRVPLADVYLIELAPRLDDEEQAEFDKLVRALADGSYKVRDQAMSALMAAGQRHYTALAAAKEACADKEALRRLEQVYQALVAKYGRTPPPRHDYVHTADFKIKGLVRQRTVRAWTLLTPAAAEVNLRRIKAVARRAGARAVRVPADDAWHDAGVTVVQGEIEIAAGGNVDLWPLGPGQYVATPKGWNASGKVPQYLAGALIGRFDDGQSFLVGERWVGRGTGRLQLQVVGSPWHNACQGEYAVTIRPTD